MIIFLFWKYKIRDFLFFIDVINEKIEDITFLWTIVRMTFTCHSMIEIILDNYSPHTRKDIDNVIEMKAISENISELVFIWNLWITLISI